MTKLKQLKFEWDMAKGIFGKNRFHDKIQALYNAGLLSITDYREITEYMRKN